MTKPSCFLDPIAQRCADLVNAQIGGGQTYSADDFKGGPDKLSSVELALRSLVLSASNVVRNCEEMVNSGQPTIEAEKRLLAFKVPHAGDLLNEAFNATTLICRNAPGTDRLATFHAELAKRHLGVFIDRESRVAAQD